jgi:hypothetical protein
MLSLIAFANYKLLSLRRQNRWDSVRAPAHSRKQRCSSFKAWTYRLLLQMFNGEYSNVGTLHEVRVGRADVDSPSLALLARRCCSALARCLRRDSSQRLLPFVIFAIFCAILSQFFPTQGVAGRSSAAARYPLMMASAWFLREVYSSRNSWLPAKPRRIAKTRSSSGWDGS